MSLDLWILAAMALFAAIGYRSGAIQQLSHWIGLAVAYLCAKPLAAALAPVLAERMGWPPGLTAVGVSVVSMPVVLLVSVLLARMLLNALIPGDQRNKPDRIAGIFFGAGKAGVIAWAVLSAGVSFEKSALLPAGAKAALGESRAAAFTRDHGLFVAAQPETMEKLRTLAALRDDPQRAEALLKDPALKAIFDDPAVKRALEKGDPTALLENPGLVKKIEAMKTR